MPAGKKKCPKCEAEVGASKKTCECGHAFVKGAKAPNPKAAKKAGAKKSAKADALAMTEKALIDAGRHLASAVRESVDVEDSPELKAALDIYDLAANIYGIVRG